MKLLLFLWSLLNAQVLTKFVSQPKMIMGIFVNIPIHLKQKQSKMNGC